MLDGFVYKKVLTKFAKVNVLDWNDKDVVTIRKNIIDLFTSSRYPILPKSLKGSIQV